MHYAWVIHKGLPVDGEPLLTEKDLPVTGPRGVKLTAEQIIKHPKAQRFRLKDSDGNAYCEGYLVDLTPGKESQVTGFEPLDDYGMPGLGAAEIQFWEKGKGGGWKSL